MNRAWTDRQRNLAERAILLCLITVLSASTISPLYAQHQASIFPAGADARAAIYGPLLDLGTGAAPRAGLDPAVPAEGRHPVALAAGGVLGGTVGFWAGGFAGALIGASSCHIFKNGESCESGFSSALTLGMVLGEATLLPLGVHLADQRRGNFALMSLASIGIGVGGVALASGPGRDRAGPILVSTAITQLAASIIIEKWTAGRKAVPE